MQKFSLKSYLPLKKRSQFLAFCIVLSVLVVMGLLTATLLGSVDIDAAWIWKIIVNRMTGRQIYKQLWPNSIESIIWTLRLPRVFLAFIVGSGLALCGILMQALTKNSLADPYVLGISSGASAGAVAVIMFGWFRFAGAYHIMLGATIGAVLAIVLAMNIATINHKVTAIQLILSGIAVAALFSACTNVMIYHTQTGSDKMKTALYWMIGSLSGATWEMMFYVATVFFACAVAVYLVHTSLDVLLLGDDAATTLGVNLQVTKVRIIVLCTVLTGAIVSVSGVIGFVGLVIPHMTRSIVGAKHCRLIPAAILVGGFFLIACDVISRVIVAPEELPIGVVTSFFGAPFFLLLIRKSKNSFGGKS